MLSRLLQAVAPVLSLKRGQPMPPQLAPVAVRLGALQKAQAKLSSVLPVLRPQLVRGCTYVDAGLQCQHIGADLPCRQCHPVRMQRPQCTAAGCRQR